MVAKLRTAMRMVILENKDIVKHAYKKLKSSVYYDRTLPFLRNAIVQFEIDYPGEKLDRHLDDIYWKLMDAKAFSRWLEKVDFFNRISVISFPKKLSDVDEEKENMTEGQSNKSTTNDTNDTKKSEAGFWTNYAPKEIEVEELQHFIDMPVEGHLLGVLWVMLIGSRLATHFYEHSYGNRIRKKLINEFSEKTTYSPYLFEPYFEQYESWRDRAMDEAEKHMSMKQDVVIITMDFKRYYYSLDVNHKMMDEIYETVIQDNDDVVFRAFCGNLNRFVCDVIDQYALLFDSSFEGRRILPIGFLPSNVIGNWCLNRFDNAIVDGWNPVYYGRYVDDILIVDKIERNSDLQKKARNGELRKQDIIEFFLTSCGRWNGLPGVQCEETKKYAVLQIDDQAKEKTRSSEGKDEDTTYRVNPRYNPLGIDENREDKTKIIVQNDKVKIFYFAWNESDALISRFRNDIARNKSEFRHLPEDEAVFQRDDYSDIYSLLRRDSPNKFRGIDGVSLNKYELSKFLGKYLRIAGLIRDKAESRFEKDIQKIFNARAIIENHTMWEKIIEILVINERFEALKSFCKRIDEAINAVAIKRKEDVSGTDSVEDTLSKVKKALYINLHACLCRCMALVWKRGRHDVQKEIYETILTKEKVGDVDADEMIKGYYNSRMIDKSVIPVITEMIDFPLESQDADVNLTRFEEIVPKAKGKWESDYKYFPYIVGMYDFNIVSCMEAIHRYGVTDSIFQGGIVFGKNPFGSLEEEYKKTKYRYIFTNYQYKGEDQEKYKNPVGVFKLPFRGEDSEEGFYIVQAGDGRKNKLKVALANVRLNHLNFEKIVKDRPNRSYYRYRELSVLVNSAIDQKADILVMPEAFVPFEWLSTLARTCAKSKMAVVTGVEHLKQNGRVYNFTATILPYEEDTYRCALIAFHLKKYYAPSEVELIKGYRLEPVVGKSLELYHWNGCYFPVYCCYELTSITDRSVFQSYSDMLVAVEWNHDVKYFSNILEALSRDLHCYCVQVNSSDYGDSRITKPTKSDEKDLIRTKGGINSSILVDEIDIEALRDFQIKEYSLQKKDASFKVTPPNLDKEIVMKKIKGVPLFDEKDNQN